MASVRSVRSMITNISIVSVFVKDVDESKRFYTTVLGFEAKDDITLGDGYRWCTVNHPSQPELAVHLTVPGPPFSPELVEAMQRAQDLLRATNLTVTEVCHAVGFSSLGSFSSRFREVVGETPSGFQRRYAVTGAPRIPGCYDFQWGLAERASQERQEATTGS